MQDVLLLEADFETNILCIYFEALEIIFSLVNCVAPAMSSAYMRAPIRTAGKCELFQGLIAKPSMLIESICEECTQVV